MSREEGSKLKDKAYLHILKKIETEYGLENLTNGIKPKQRRKKLATKVFMFFEQKTA